MKSILLACLITVVYTSCAQDRSSQLDSLFNKLYEENDFTGNVLIAENGKPIFQKSYGQAFREKNIDLNSETVFELASVSKQFTAMGIMILKKQGKLSYDDNLRRFISELPYTNITIRHLLQHTSGLPDYFQFTQPHWDSTKIMTNDDIISIMEKHHPPVLFAPGEKWEYSNTGYALLASVIERASGKSFQEFLSENIFKPLGMNRTRVYRKRFEKSTIDNYAYGYVKNDAGTYVMADSLPETAAMVYSMDGVYGDGVVNSTAGDLLKWDQALYTDKLVSNAMMAEAFADAILNNGQTSNYGFGWLLMNSAEIGRYFFHGGGWPGYSTWLERHPRDNKTIILLANAGSANKQLRAIRNIVYGIESKPPVEVRLDEKVLKQYEGSYAFSNGVMLNIRVDEGRIFGDMGGSNEHQLFAEAVDLLFRKDRDDIRIRMVKDDSGMVTGLEILMEGPVMAASKSGSGSDIEK